MCPPLRPITVTMELKDMISQFRPPASETLKAGLGGTLRLAASPEAHGVREESSLRIATGMLSLLERKDGKSLGRTQMILTARLF